jgi:hypothetical protein
MGTCVGGGVDMPVGTWHSARESGRSGSYGVVCTVPSAGSSILDAGSMKDTAFVPDRNELA